jgi:sulfate permease, SulP family
MNAQTGQLGLGPSWIGDFWGGLTAMLVALPSSVAFGVLVFTAMGPGLAGQGAMVGMFGAAALGLVAPLVGRTGGLISAPCAPAAAVLAALVAELLSRTGGAAVRPESVPAILALTGLLAAGLQVLYGAIGGGRLIKFVPYPVVSGYLSGVGILIALGQLPKLLGLPKGMGLAQGLFRPAAWQWQGLTVGLITIVVVGVAPRLTRRVPAAILGLASGLAAYFALAAFWPAMRGMAGNPLVIGPMPAPGPFLEALTGRAGAVGALDPACLRAIVVPALTLSVLLSIDTLKTCVVLDALTGTRHKSDRELVGQGAGNLVAALAGGMPGSGCMGPTLVGLASGARTHRAGLIEGALALLAIALLGPLIAWVPIAVLAGILLVVAWRMFDRGMFRLAFHPAGRMDFAVILAVVLVAVTVDLIAASGVGVALAILLFLRDQVRGSVIRRKRDLAQISSKTCRLAADRAILDRCGNQGVLCELQGNLFFGTADQLFTQLEPDLKMARYVLLDMRRVQSIDYTAAHLFEQMEGRLAQRGGRLLFSGMPSTIFDRRGMEHYLTELGVVRKGGYVMISETLDAALEWMEESILAGQIGPRQGEGPPLEIKDIDLFRGLDEQALAALARCTREQSAAEGQRILTHSDPGDDIFFVRRGSVQIMLPLVGGKRHHLATIGRGDFFGELTFLDRGIRSTDVEAKVPTDLYLLSRSDFTALAETGAPFCVEITARLAVAIARRLRQADAELRMLDER